MDCAAHPFTFFPLQQCNHLILAALSLFHKREERITMHFICFLKALR
jgi:hypothetical protein